jgi:hypothetical protein
LYVVLIEQYVVGDLILAIECASVELVHLGGESFQQPMVIIALPHTDGIELPRVPVEERAVEDADLREQLRVVQQENQRLAVRQLLDGEGLAPADPVDAVGASEEQDKRDPSEYFATRFHDGVGPPSGSLARSRALARRVSGQASADYCLSRALR